MFVYFTEPDCVAHEPEFQYPFVMSPELSCNRQIYSQGSMIGGKVGKQRADPNRQRYAESEFTGFQKRAFLGIVRVIENLNQVPLPIHAFELAYSGPS